MDEDIENNVMRNIGNVVRIKTKKKEFVGKIQRVAENVIVIEDYNDITKEVPLKKINMSEVNSIEHLSGFSTIK